MTLDANFIQKILDLAPAREHQIAGKTYTDKQLFLIKPPVLSCIQVNTVTAVEDFCRNKLAADGNKYIIHIEGPTSIQVMSDADEDFKLRECPINAKLLSESFVFGRFMPTEMFIIALQSQFVQDETTAALLRLVGNLTTTSESKTLDDGVTQTVEARKGLSKLEMAVVPNPVMLAPYRTFLEVEQPYSNFVFRINADSHSCALFEADGGAWKNEAVLRLKERITGTLADINKDGKFTVLA